MSYQRTRLSSRPQPGASGDAFTCRLVASPSATASGGSTPCATHERNARDAQKHVRLAAHRQRALDAALEHRAEGSGRALLVTVSHQPEWPRLAARLVDVLVAGSHAQARAKVMEAVRALEGRERTVELDHAITRLRLRVATKRRERQQVLVLARAGAEACVEAAAHPGRSEDAYLGREEPVDPRHLGRPQCEAAVVLLVRVRVRVRVR
eukprot:scaffold563_cov66-Phaeocystis_antarctica.AAC.1